MINITEYGTIGKSTSIICSKDNNTSYELKVVITSSNTSAGKVYALINRNGEPIIDATRFITNPTKKTLSYNTKEKELIHIGMLYKFLDAFDIKLNDLVNDENYILKLLHFIAKNNYNNPDEEITMSFIRPLSSDTCALYFSTIQKYLLFLDFDKNSLIFESRFKKFLTNKKSIKSIKAKGCADANSSFSEDELSKMFYLASQTNKTFYVGLLILFETGMRIGTLLSITEEDVFYEMDKNGNILRYYIKTRNRFSNKQYQLIKNLPKIYDKDYVPNHLQDRENVDYFVYTISYDLYTMIQEVIDLNYKNSAKSDVAKNHYNTDAIADKYYYHIKQKHKFNRYIFLNAKCSRMSDKNWNKTYMKPILDKLGIYHDKEIKKYGLNHLMRHTAYTILCAKGILTTDAEKLSFLKNTSLETLQTYYSPTTEMQKAISLIQTQTWKELELKGKDCVNDLQDESNALLDLAGDI